MSTSTATRATRVGKMTKEDNSDIVAADTATAQGKTESNVAAVETVTATADTASATVAEQSNDADKLNSSKEEEQKKEASAAATSATATANAGDASVKPDATMTEATPVAHDTISGDVEFTANFPQKLMEILSNEEYNDIIHWLPHGKGFIIANKKRFADEVLPKYFKKAKFTSFTRKLNRWNFVRITRGPEVGSYFHPNFQKDDLNLVSQMTCIGSKQPQAVKPLDPIALGVVPMGEPVDTATEALGGIEQWQRQDHERYRLFYQQNHWNYMMQVMQQASAAKLQQDSDAAVTGVATGTAAASEESTTAPVKQENTEVDKTDDKKVEAKDAGDEPPSLKASL